jgi:predicted DCC family thiol-disulfide oxidoreductase YuxK
MRTLDAVAVEFENPIILFDGVCNLCEHSVQFVIRNDRRARYRFAALQSPAAARILATHDYRHDGLSSVLLIADGAVHRKSRAALRILRHLDRPWPLLYYLFFWVPARVADPVYDFVGNRRYRWFGRKQSCWMPDPDLRRRFIDQGTGPDDATSAA